MPKSSKYNVRKDLVAAVLNNPWEAHLLVDERGIIRFLSSSNERFYGVTAEEVIGKHVYEMNPDSMLPVC